MTDDRSSVPDRASDANDDAWREFPNTVLHFRSTSIDLRSRVESPVLIQLAAAGLPGPFGIITGCNPMGRATVASDNAVRNNRLHATLIAGGWRCIAVNACSPDRSHCEASFAVEGDRDALLRLARHYEQLAIFWFDSARFWIVPAEPDRDPIKLPVK